MMPEDQSQSTKMFGYMEKRGKMSIRGRWKQRWCVLEGHLLLFYKSQTEYLKLSPCCGSLNMTLVRKIQPHVGYLIHITTHSQTIILRTPNKEKQEQWFNALAAVLIDTYQDGLRYSDDLFPTTSFLRKEKRKNKRSVRISETNELNHSDDTKFDDSVEENNNSTKLTSLSDGTEKLSSQSILKINLYHRIINRCSSDSNIYASPTKNNCREFSRSYSCGCISAYPIRNQSILGKSVYDDLDDQRKKRRSKVHWNDAENDALFNGESNEPVLRRNSKRRNKNKVVHRHSFSFLKEFLTKRKGRQLRKEAQKQQIRALQDLKNSFITSIIAVTTTLHVENDSEPEEITPTQEPSHESNSSVIITEEIIVSTTSTNEGIKIEDRRSWTMKEYERPVPNEVLPELPIKTKKNCARYSWQEEESTVNPEMVDPTETSNPNTELDELMSQLINLNQRPLRASLRPPDDNIPDYDIPRSHLSIISEILTDPESSSIASSDSRYINSLSFTMDPDSLDMPWLSRDGLNDHKYWPATSGDHFFLRNNVEFDNEDSYLDSLNT